MADSTESSAESSLGFVSCIIANITDYVVIQRSHLTAQRQRRKTI